MSKKWKKIGLIILSVIVLVLIGSGIYIKTATYAPTTQAQNVAKQQADIKGALKFPGDKQKPAILFYQGAFVEEESYSLWAQQLADAGYTVYLLREPLNLAVLSPNKAQQIIKDEQLTNYVIGGHSLGGVMASRFAAEKNDDHDLKGIFFLASYPDEKGSLRSFNGSVLSITATNDGVLNWSAYKKAKSYLPEQTVYEKITGGNHAGFGSYGNQKGDKKADIDNEEQQNEVAQALLKWLEHINN
jgi:dienelactone hydrolase